MTAPADSRISDEMNGQSAGHPIEQLLIDAYVRGVEWCEENPLDREYRFKAARDYADKALTVLASLAPQQPLTELRERRAQAVTVKPLDDDQIMELIREVAPWKTEPKLNDLLTYEKSPPLFPQATYDVPSYQAKRFVRAVEARIFSALTDPPPAQTAGVTEAIIPYNNCRYPACQCIRADGECADAGLSAAGDDFDRVADAELVERMAPAVAGEVERYIARANELAEDGRYPWWSRLAEILSSYDALAAAKDAEWSELLNAAVADYNETKRTNRELVGKLSICERRISEMQATMSDMAQSWTRRSEAEEK